MDSIELTEEHKSKLLEMCNKLFPDYNEIILTKQKTLNFGFKDNKSHTSRIANMSIHWFEFCITKLPYKIFDSSKYPSKNAGDDTVQYLCDMMDRQTWYIKEAYHPVDYLYEEFKKLK